MFLDPGTMYEMVALCYNPIGCAPMVKDNSVIQECFDDMACTSSVCISIESLLYW